MKVFNKLDINPTNMNLYMEAVTHSSFTNENPSYPDYERLEFLGDAVLEIIISEYLYKERHLEEGTMTRMRASYVCEEACATYAKEIGLDLDIKVGTGEEINQTILADVFEAFVAALYLDQGFEFTRSFVLNIILIKLWNSIGASIATVASELVVLIVQLYMVRNDLDIKDVFKGAKNYLISSLIMFAVCMLIKHFINVGIISIVVQVAIGGAVYIGMLLILKDENVFMFIDKIKEKINSILSRN